MKIVLNFIGLLLIFVSCSTLAASGRVHFKDVVAVKVGNTGYFEIKFAEAHEDPGMCGANSSGIFIDKDHPGKDMMLSLALYAKASGKQVTAWIDGCLDGYGNRVYNLEWVS